MFQKLVSHNKDIEKLVQKGYALAIDSSNHLVIRDIPYLDEKGQLKIGALVAKLQFLDKWSIGQQDHQVYFAGGAPYLENGEPVRGLGGGKISIALSSDCEDVVVERSFSNKPKAAQKYEDHFHKVETYVGFISGPAINKYGVSPYTYRVIDSFCEDPIFNFQDTLTSRSDIFDLSKKFENHIVSVIGLGGTGGYVADLISKTPIKEIRLYDHDKFHVHNAFRSPGRLEENEFGKGKAEIYASRYSVFRREVLGFDKYVDHTCGAEFSDVTFVFVCVDDGDARKEIFDLLQRLNIPFVDVGMGLKRDILGSIKGMVRVTHFSVEKGAMTRSKKYAPEKEDPDNLYKTNVQIAELNALNACLAVIQFKKTIGFYSGDHNIANMLFNLSTLSLVSDDDTDED